MIFKTNKNIFQDNGEYFESHWMNSNKRIMPTTKTWDYSRELQIENIDIWEVVWEGAGGWGIYAAWSPFAEYYMLKIGVSSGNSNNMSIETFYGSNAQNKLIKRAESLNIKLNLTQSWVEPEDMWLYT